MYNAALYAMKRDFFLRENSFRRRSVRYRSSWTGFIPPISTRRSMRLVAEPISTISAAAVRPRSATVGVARNVGSPEQDLGRQKCKPADS